MKDFFPLLLLTVKKPLHEKGKLWSQRYEFYHGQSFWDYVKLLCQSNKSSRMTVLRLPRKIYFGFLVHLHYTSIRVWSNNNCSCKGREKYSHACSWEMVLKTSVPLLTQLHKWLLFHDQMIFTLAEILQFFSRTWGKKELWPLPPQSVGTGLFSAKILG